MKQKENKMNEELQVNADIMAWLENQVDQLNLKDEQG